jgi:hypothetical protein
MRLALKLCLVLFCSATAFGQKGVTVELDEVTDNRMSNTGEEFQLRGGLELRVKLAGAGLEKALGARAFVTEAKDDLGNSLKDATPGNKPDFTSREYNNGTLQLSVSQPSRAASSVRVKGTVELYVPDRDPAATVKVDDIFSKLDAPLTAKALKTAKLSITPLSKAKYAELMKSRKITEKDIAEIRVQGKAHGASDKEIEMAIGMAQAMEGMDGPTLSDTSFALSGKKTDFDRIYRIEILGPDGTPISFQSRGTSSRGDDTLMTMEGTVPLPEKASMQIMLITDKTRVTSPFDLKVPLP